MKKLLLLILIPSFIFSQEPNIITTFEFGTKPLLINELDVTKNKENVYKIIVSYCKSYEELCQKKYPEAPLPLEILKSLH